MTESEERLTKLRARRLYRGPNWETIRTAIIARDKARVRCGEQNPERLVVHHITPWSETQDNRPGNLITLCGKHHGSEHNYMKRLYKPSPLVRIYLKTLSLYKGI